jgi:type IV pilus assembly protein PilW
VQQNSIEHQESMMGHIHSASRQQGATIIELMIGIAIGLIIVAGMALLFSNTSISRSELEKSSRMIENGRYAIELLEDDIKHAGFYDLLGIPAGYSLNRVDACTTSGNFGFVAGTSVATPLFGYDNSWAANCTTPNGSTERKYRTGTDVLVVRRVASGAPVAPAASSTSSLYLQVSACSKDSTTISPLVLANGQSSSFTLRDKNCGNGAPPTRPVRQFISRVYFVADCNDCTGATDQIPTLKMLELQGNSLVAVPLVEGVEDMQLEYRLDTNGDGIADAFNVKASGIIDDCAGASPAGYCWANVMAVDIYLLARNTELTVGHLDDRTYALGSQTSDVKSISGDDRKFKRHAYTVTAQATNISIQREKP